MGVLSEEKAWTSKFCRLAPHKKPINDVIAFYEKVIKVKADVAAFLN
jgi:hypothetical protein